MCLGQISEIHTCLNAENEGRENLRYLGTVRYLWEGGMGEKLGRPKFFFKEGTANFQTRI